MLNTPIEKESTQIINIHTARKICHSRHNLSQWLYSNKGDKPKLYLLAIRVLSNLLSELNKYSFYSRNRVFFPPNKVFSCFTLLEQNFLLQKLFCPLRYYFRAWAWSWLAFCSARPWLVNKLQSSTNRFTNVPYFSCLIKPAGVLRDPLLNCTYLTGLKNLWLMPLAFCHIQYTRLPVVLNGMDFWSTSMVLYIG